MVSLVFIVIGILSLIIVIVFKKQINKYYENVKGLSKSHAKFYKNIIVFFVPIIFIIAGLIQYILPLIDENFKTKIINLYESTDINFQIIAGSLFILFGIFTFILRFTSYKYKYFAKLSVMEEKYGKVEGNIIHSISYTLVPICFGIYLLFKYLN
ncbi:MAG: hypothetical protein A2Y30_01450 [Spirochaetes bacterium GWE1_32_154]|nr:MAG: hypothetical protein A2Y30_01450 [Spirochaetes bacterium GWE1_32_154]